MRCELTDADKRKKERKKAVKYTRKKNQIILLTPSSEFIMYMTDAMMFGGEYLMTQKGCGEWPCDMYADREVVNVAGK